MRPYDDDRYLEWPSEFRALVNEFLDTEGNSKFTLDEEYQQAVAEAESEVS